MTRFLLPLLLLAALAAGQDDDAPRVWVHVPAEDLLGMFPKKGAGFLISIDEYRKLRTLAHENATARREQPPLPGYLVNGTVTARVDGDVLRLEASYVAVVESDEPTEIPFGLERIALERIAVEGGELAHGRLRFAKAGTYNVSATLSARLARAGDTRRAEFRLPPAAAHTVALDLPAEVEGEVGPIVRAFRTGAGGARVVGYPDGRGLFKLWFQPRSPARALDALLSARFDTVADIGEARTMLRTGLRVDVLRAPVSKLDLALAPGQTVRALEGKGVRSWRLVRGGADGADRLEIRFVEPVQRTVQLGLQTEMPRDALETARIPIVRVPGAVRYLGTVGVAAQPEVKLQALRATGARRLDTGGRDPRLALFEVWSPEAEVTATLARVASDTRARTSVLLSLHEGGKRLQAAFRYFIAGKPLFRLEASVPAGWILRRVVLDGKEVPHRYEGGTLRLDFPHGLKPGRHLLYVALETDEVDWVPADGAATFELAGVGAGLPEESGHLVVESDPAFRVTAGARSGLRSVAMDEAAAEFGGVREQMLFAWRFERPGYAARFRIERQPPQISAVVVNELWPSERLLRVHANVLVDIRRAGVRELKVTLPAGTGPLVDFQGPLIKERRAPPADAEGDETWTLVFQRRIRGSYRFSIGFDRKFEEDRWRATAPAIRIPDAEERGFVVVHTSGTTALDVEPDGLREADVGELPYALSKPALEVLAYAQHPYEVTVASERHDPEAVVQAIALSAEVYGVLSHDGRLRCRARYRIRNNDQPFLRFALPRGSRLVGALVDGEPAKPLLEDGLSKVPLPRSANRDTPFTVDVIYETAVDALGEDDVVVARPALDIDVLKTTYKLHLPTGYELVDHDGDLVPLSARERRTVKQLVGDYLDAVTPFGSGAAAGAPETAETRYDAGPDQDLDEEEEQDAEATVEAESARRSKNVKDKAKENRKPESEKKADARPAAPRTPAEEPANADGDGAEDSLGEDGISDMPFEGKPRPQPRKGGFVAHGGKEGGGPTGGEAPDAGKRARPEKALLSLDVEFLRSDNVVVLDSLAPTGSVTLQFARTERFTRHRFVGLVLGAAVAALALLTRRRGTLRVVGAVALALVALHYAGLSFLSDGLARGTAEALLVIALALLPWRLLGRLVRRARRPKPAPIVALLLAVTAAHAQEEILVPYGDDPLKVERVFLPAEEYHRLRKLAYPETAGRATAFTAARYEARLARDELTVTATYGIVKETEAAERVPLALDGVAVTQALLDGAPARLAVAKKGYELVLAGKGRHTLVLALRPRLVERGERLSFSCPVRPVADARLVLTHDRERHEVDVVGLGAETDGVHHIGPVGTLGATWTPETEGFRATAAELRARTEMRISVRDGFTAVAARVHYGISGGTTDRVRIRVEPALVVRHVACAGLAGWQREADGTLVVALAKPQANALVVEIHGERPAERERTEAAPAVEPLDVLRDAGVIALDTLPDLEIELLDTQGLLRGRHEQTPPKLLAAPDPGVVQSVHRFALRPFQLRWRVSVAQTRLRATTKVDVFLQPESTFVDVDLLVEVERGPGPFTVPLSIPTGYEVSGASGPIRDWWVDEGVLRMDRRQRQTGAQKYRVVLRRRGTTGDTFAAPAVFVPGAVRETGRVRIAVDDGLELRVGETTNLLPEDASKAGKVRWGRLVRAYRYVSVPWRLEVSTREEPREMEALVVSRVVPLADRVLVEALVDFHVRRGLVDRFSFVVPVTEEREVLVNAPDRREIQSEAVEGGRRFTVLLRTPTRGSTSATVSYHLPYGPPVRGVEPAGVERVRRFVAVEKVADGEVKFGATENLDPGSFDDLPLRPPESTPQSVAGVFVGSGGPLALGLTVKRHTFEEVAKAVIYRAGAEAVVDRSGFTRVLVAYRVYNRSEQFLRLRLPDGAQLYSVVVAGEGVRPLGEGGDLLVPLRKLALGAAAFDVDVLYAYAGPRVGAETFRVRLPDVRGIDVRRTTLTLHVPRGFDYAFETDMEEVDAADIAAGEVTDRYEEIKEAYAVTQRGNRLQQRRAFQNALQLQQEAQRLMDELRANTRDQKQLDQLKSQERAIKRLEAANRENVKAGKPQAPGAGEQRAARGVREWGANDAYLKKNPDAEQVEAYLDRNFRGPNSGVPPGTREPSDAEPPPPPSDPGSPAFHYFERLEKDQQAQLGRFANETAFFTPPTVIAGAHFEGIPVLADAENAGGDNDVAGVPVRLRAATGRISLRIDLPREGDRYHFAYLGKEGGVAFEADETGGALGEALLALLFAAAAAALLLYTPRP